MMCWNKNSIIIIIDGNDNSNGNSKSFNDKTLLILRAKVKNIDLKLSCGKNNNSQTKCNNDGGHILG